MTPRAAIVVACHVAASSSIACDANHGSAARDGGDGTGGESARFDASRGDASGGHATPPDGARPPPNDAAQERRRDAAEGVTESTTALDAALPGACTDDAGSPASGVACILHIDGRAIDGDGAPIPARTLVSACGPAACSPGYTTASGGFAVPVGFHLDPDVYSVELHVRPDKAGFYYALPKGAPGPVVQLGNLRVLDMPAAGPALDVERNGAPAQAVTSGDVTLEVPDGVYVRLDVESALAGEHGKEFRALTISRNYRDDFVDTTLGVRAVYALEPFESSFEYPGTPAAPAAVRLSFTNTAAFAAGAAVDVLALGSYIYPDWVTPAAFEKVASAHVSADGSRIELDPSEGLPHLTWIALRQAT